MKEYLSSVLEYFKEDFKTFRRKYFPTPKELGIVRYTYEELIERFKELNNESNLEGFPVSFARKVHAIGGTCSSRPKNLEERV